MVYYHLVIFQFANCNKWPDLHLSIILPFNIQIIYQVVPGTRWGGSFEKRTWLIGIHGELERSKSKWNEMHEMNELTRMTWDEGIETPELKRMNCHEWIEMNKLKGKNWSDLVEKNELTWMNWNEWIKKNELKWRSWHEIIEMKELKQTLAPGPTW